ncbi:hypothetical protein [Streptomyces sp. NPDC088258]|uniref:hypothetical protein n=1 Tax=Streptomyces sp. NPDC088258 TaxID=3365849 RepID=UPI0038102A90
MSSNIHRGRSACAGPGPSVTAATPAAGALGPRREPDVPELDGDDEDDDGGGGQGGSRPAGAVLSLRALARVSRFAAVA